MILAIDLMGSDRSPKELFRAVADQSRRHGSLLTTVVFLDEAAKREIFQGVGEGELPDRIVFQEADQVIGMGDSPLEAIKKERSSLIMAMRSLASGEVDALVTAGNTAAIALASKRILSMKEGVSRPFLLVELPLVEKGLILADVGANMSWSAGHLVEYALYSAEHCRKLHPHKKPLVALLNVGVEPLKGTREHREAYRRLEALSREGKAAFSFAGNIEGRDLFTSDIDIAISDGFSGNVLLKAMEGTARYISEKISEEVRGEKLFEQLQAVSRKFHYRNFSGAIVAGVNGTVIKCHGEGSYASMHSSIAGAVELLSDIK